MFPRMDAHVEGVLEFRDVVRSLRTAVTEMKERGADVVVVLSHGGFGGTSYDTVATGLPPEFSQGPSMSGRPSLPPITTILEFGESASLSVASMPFQRR